MAFIQREWKTWIKIEFLTDLKSQLSCTSFEAVSHYLFEMKFKFKTCKVNYLGRDVFSCTHNGDKLNKQLQETFISGGEAKGGILAMALLW